MSANWKRRIVPLASLLLATSLLGACAGIGDARGRVLTVDDFGDTVRLLEPAKRVVSLNPVTTELLFALGAGDKVVGRTHWDLYPEAARAVTDVGDGMGPNVEAVLGQTPDLVVLYASESNRAAVQQLRAAGVMTVAWRTDHVADLARIAPMLGAAIGDPGKGLLVSDTVTASLNAVRALARPKQPRAVFWHIWDAPIMTIGAGSYMSELLDIAGATNAFGDSKAPSPQVSLEEVAKRDPYAVLAGPNNAAKILKDPKWQVVRAVREGRVLVVDTTIVGRPGVRMGEAARHLRTLILGDTAGRK